MFWKFVGLGNARKILLFDGMVRWIEITCGGIMKDLISENINSSIKAKQGLLTQIDTIEHIAEAIVNAYRQGKKVLICGNGGSAADSQHFAAELVGRYKMERSALDAVALTVDTSILTAVGNDYGFDKIFSRQIEGLGREGDILIAISTSGNSKNIIEAIKSAKEKRMVVISFLGGTGGAIKQISDINLVIESASTPRIQECHELVMHTICDIVEQKIFRSLKSIN